MAVNECKSDLTAYGYNIGRFSDGTLLMTIPFIHVHLYMCECCARYIF